MEPLSISTLQWLAGLGPWGVVVVVLLLYWVDRKDRDKKDSTDRKNREDREDKERSERAKQAAEDRQVWTNHLSELIRDGNKSREESAVAMTQLKDAIQNFQKNCVEIQRQLQDEVNRMKQR